MFRIDFSDNGESDKIRDDLPNMFVSESET